MTVLDERSSTAKLVQDLALARYGFLTSSQQLKAAASTLKFEMRELATRKSTIVFAVLGGVLLERAVHREGSLLGSLAKTAAFLQEILLIMTPYGLK